MTEIKDDTSSAALDVRRVAELARLALSDEEAIAFQDQMDGIVQFVQKIGELNLASIEPTTHAHQVDNVFREDKVRPELEREGVLRNAPKQSDGLFVVPRIVE